MKALGDVDLVSISGGDDFSSFLTGLAVTLSVGCTVTANPAICGAAVVVVTTNLFY
jgi:hypothetical protein